MPAPKAHGPVLPPRPDLVRIPPQVVADVRPAATRPAAAATAGVVPARTSSVELSRVLQAQFLVGNAAVAAALLGVPPGGVPPGGVSPGGVSPDWPAVGGTGPAPQAGPGPSAPLSPAGPAGETAAAVLVAAAAPPAPAVEAAPGAPAAGPGGAAAGPPVAAPPAGGAPAGGAPMPVRPRAERDPRFAVLTQDVHAKKRRVAASHPPARTEAGAAQAAAKPPPDDKVAQGKVANADQMNDAKPKEFDKAAFIKAVQQAIAAQAPKNLEQADQFADSDKPAQIKKDVQARVGQGEQDSASDIATTTAAAPDTSKAVTKPVVPMGPDRPPGAPGTPDPANAVPDKLPPSVTDLSGGPREVDRQMAAAQVTEPQLAHANERTFSTALNQKHVAEQDAARATPAMRGHEAATLKDATAGAERQGAAGMRHLAAARVATGQKVTAGKVGTKGRDEAERARVTGVLQAVFDATKKDVEGILKGLDRKVDEQFTREEKQARDLFTAEHKAKMAEYKAKRYGGKLGWYRWGKDKLFGLPKEADQIFVTARDHYITRMQVVIADVADTIGAELHRAKTRIAQGRADLQAAVTHLPADLCAIGARAAEEFTGKFDELTQSVDEKSSELVQTLASKYNEALKSVDDEIAKEKAKNRGLVARAVDAVKGVIATILELKNLLLGVLRKAASAVMLILKDPIGFLRNLVSAVGAGLKQFLKNIVRHLEQGLLSWLLGVTAQAGLVLPRSFDIKGILVLLADLLGLTWPAIRTRIVRKGVPEPAVVAAETSLPLLSKARRQGVAGLWDDIRAQVGDLKHTLISKVTEYLIPTIITAGIVWVLSLLNPASAFVRACKLIIDIVQFIVQRGRQVIDFVNAVLDAVIAIARGGTGGVPGLIENALARSIPVLIGFLASLLGIGGLADKVKKIFETLSKPVMKAVDWVIDKIVGLVKKLWAKLKGLLGKAKRGLGRLGDRIRGRRPDTRSDKEKNDALDAALREATGLIGEEDATAKSVRRGLPKIKKRYRLASARLVAQGPDTYVVELVINPKKDTPPKKLPQDTFPYQIEKVDGPVKVTRLALVVSTLHTIEIPMWGKDPIAGFVVNIAAAPGDVKPSTAARYVDAAWGGADARDLAVARTAVVVGVNTWERLDPIKGEGKDQVLAAISRVEHPGEMLVAVFGFLWTPRWIDTIDKRDVSLAEVRQAYQQLSSKDKKTAVATNESGWRDDEKLPYGIFREEVLGSTHTHTAVRKLAAARFEVHILSQDADTGVLTSSGQGVLAAYDKILQEAGRHPLLTIGGYMFEHFDWGKHADPRTRQLTLLANRLDRAIRAGVAKKHPQMLYPTEPNLLIKAWDPQYLDGIFQNAQLRAELESERGSFYGSGDAEGRHARDRLMELYGSGFTVDYRPEASTSTDPLPGDPTRKLTVTPAGVLASASGDPKKKRKKHVRKEHPAYALILQSQTYASAETLARELRMANPKLRSTDQDAMERKVFVHVEETIKLLADNPQLSVWSPEVKEKIRAFRQDITQARLRGTGAEGRELRRQAVDQASAVTRQIVRAMTAPELRTLWSELHELLEQIMNEARRAESGAQ